MCSAWSPGIRCVPRRVPTQDGYAANFQPLDPTLPTRLAGYRLFEGRVPGYPDNIECISLTKSNEKWSHEATTTAVVATTRRQKREYNHFLENLEGKFYRVPVYPPSGNRVFGERGTHLCPGCPTNPWRKSFWCSNTRVVMASKRRAATGGYMLYV